MSAPRKRSAFEPAASLLTPTRYDPGMRRPAATTAGAVLVLLRVLAGVAWLVDVAAHWSDYVGQLDVAAPGIALAPDAVQSSLLLFLGVSAAVLLVETVLAFLILAGRNGPRVVVMAFAVVSIVSAFVGWWVEGQEITLKTSLVSLAFDILVLLALSSRSAAAYARRAERR